MNTIQKTTILRIIKLNIHIKSRNLIINKILIKIMSRYRHIVDTRQGLARANSRVQTWELCASPNASNYQGEVI